MRLPQSADLWSVLAVSPFNDYSLEADLGKKNIVEQKFT